MDHRHYTCPRCPSTVFKRKVRLTEIEWQDINEYAFVYDSDTSETLAYEVLLMICDACDYEGPEADFRHHVKEAPPGTPNVS